MINSMTDLYLGQCLHWKKAIFNASVLNYVHNIHLSIDHCNLFSFKTILSLFFVMLLQIEMRFKEKQSIYSRWIFCCHHMLNVNEQPDLSQTLSIQMQQHRQQVSIYFLLTHLFKFVLE